MVNLFDQLCNTGQETSPSKPHIKPITSSGARAYDSERHVALSKALQLNSLSIMCLLQLFQ